METTILLLVLLTLISIVVGIQIIQKKKRVKQKAEYPELWRQFELSKEKNDLEDIAKLGNKLFFHAFLPTEHLQIIHDTAQELESTLPEFKDLRLNAQNKLQERKRQ